MSYYEQIYDEAIGKNGLITSRQAKRMGIPVVELVKLTCRGKLTRLAHGVYRIDKFVPRDSDPYAVAVAVCGDGAYIIGESVLAFYDLCPVRTNVIYVGTPNRIRRELPRTLVLKRLNTADGLTLMDGIPAQTIPAAILEAKNTVERARLLEAVENAFDRQLITAHERKTLLKGLATGRCKVEI